MQNYNTIEEKVTAWNISVRHMQYLCRTGKIKGAVKRAGAWFIPEDAPIPTKNTKSNTPNFKFVGTKNKIFNSAITLFASKGFAYVSFKDIADSIGIRPSTVYRHFKTKQELLDTIYDYYSHYYTQERIGLPDMKRILLNENLTDIIGCIRYEFKEEYRQKMTDITIIIFQRIGMDKKARELIKSLMIEEGIHYVESIFNIAVESKRLAPFDTHLMAAFINIIRIFTLLYWVIETSGEDRKKISNIEQRLYAYAVNFLPDLKATAL